MSGGISRPLTLTIYCAGSKDTVHIPWMEGVGINKNGSLIVWCPSCKAKHSFNMQSEPPKPNWHKGSAETPEPVKEVKKDELPKSEIPNPRIPPGKRRL